MILESEPIGEVRVAAPAVALDYAGPTAAPPTPFGSFVFAATLFGATHWAVDCLVSLAVLPENWSARRPWHVRLLSQDFWSQAFYELSLTTVAVAIAIGAQWLAWRVRPIVGRTRRVGAVALAAGLLYCAAGWGMYQLSDRTPFRSERVQWLIQAALAAVAGLAIAWWRGRPAPDALPTRRDNG